MFNVLIASFFSTSSYFLGASTFNFLSISIDNITGDEKCLSLPLLTADVCFNVCQEKVIPCLLRLEQASDPGLRAAVREALALVGYHKPVKGRGIRILSIDGGGLR